MSDQQPEKIEVAVPKVETGTVNFLNKSGFNHPAPERMKRIFKALNTFSVGLIGIVGATDIFTGKQAKVISLCLAVFILALNSIEFGTGVKPINEDQK